jgi:hypothetical protein
VLVRVMYPTSGCSIEEIPPRGNCFHGSRVNG